MLPSVLDTVGWVILPVKPVPDMTYNVFGRDVKPYSINQTRMQFIQSKMADCAVQK